MLHKLYKKLNIMFVTSIMSIITLIIVFISFTNIETERLNESTFFQRMSMLLIYQIEDDQQDFIPVIKEFEQKYDIYINLQDDKKNTLYESSLAFSTNGIELTNQLKQQVESQQSLSLNPNETTVQGGIFELDGSSYEHYWGIPAKIISKSNTTYHMTLLYRQPSTFNLIKTQLPMYLCIWFASLLGVLILCKILLKKAFEPTEQGLKSQKDFIASASHELKNPLAILLANVEKVEHLNIDDTELKTSLRVMDNECMRMSKLIQDMLLLASSDSKSWTLKKEDINIDTLLIQLYESYESLCSQQDIKLTLDIDDCSYPNIHTDRERLFQILCIFMDNAIQHSHNNSKIEIQTELTSKNITFLISDHGDGIAKQDKPYVFDRFYCSDKSHTNKANFGLGLSIGDELAKILNGKVGFKDTSGGGATFFVTLPL